MMRSVYIASPYTNGDTGLNVRESILTADKLVELGFLPYSPLLTHFWHIISPHPYQYWMEMDLEWLLKCDCVLRMGGESAGADLEVKTAIQHNIPVYYSVEELVKGES